LKCLGKYEGTFEAHNSRTKCSGMLHEDCANEDCANEDCTIRQILLFSHTCTQWRSEHILTKRPLRKKCNGFRIQTSL